MAQKGIREFDAKRLLAWYLPEFAKDVSYEGKVALVDPGINIEELKKQNPWLNKTRLVAKPDQLFGKRGKNNLLLLDANVNEVENWINERMDKEVTIGTVTGKLTHFLIEPFIKHDEEYYVAIRSRRECDTIYFSLSGGINIEENWESVKEIQIPVLGKVDDIDLKNELNLEGVTNKDVIYDFIQGLFNFFRKLNFVYLEINPFTIIHNQVIPLDMVAKMDDTAFFECSEYWKDIDFPAAFGKLLSKEEEYITSLDEKSGSSLKLNVMNPDGRIWLMVAGGGASVIYTDTVVDLGCMNELANYGEYSGNPTTGETREYARTILDLMTRKKNPDGKALLIGGGIANFTDVAKTFIGIIEALTEYKKQLIDNKVSIYVRRGGPNYQEGLEKMRKLGDKIGVPIEVYGPETHMTKIVSIAIENLGLGR